MLQKKLFIAAAVALLVADIALAAQNINLQKEIQQERITIAQDASNRQTVDFLQAFVDKVLRAKSEISFDDRLQLENMVRNLKDDAILAEWNKFVNSQTPAAAQEEVKNLLELLVRKIR